jgi:hypothetical protein
MASPPLWAHVLSFSRESKSLSALSIENEDRRNDEKIDYQRILRPIVPQITPETPPAIISETMNTAMF